VDTTLHTGSWRSSEVDFPQLAVTEAYTRYGMVSQMSNR